MPIASQGQRQKASQERVRRLLGNIRHQPGQAAGHAFVALALAAGQDALRCAGRGWYPESDVTASAHPGQPILLELIGFKRIEIRINPDVLAQRAAALQASAATDPMNSVLGAVRSFVLLYAGHYDWCPRDLWGHRRLVDAANWGAYRTYYPTESEMRIAASIAAFFERSIVSYHLTREEGAVYATGLAMERSLNQHPAHFLWALFQRSQAVLFPAEWEQASRICHWDPDPAADALLKDVLAILFRARLGTVRGQLRLRGRIRCPAAWEWTEAVEALAELLIPYLAPDGNSGPPQPNPFLPAGSRRPHPGGTEPAIDPGDQVNPFLNSQHPNAQSTQANSQAAGMLPGRGQGRGQACGFEELDDYYSSQARSLQVRDSGKDRGEEAPELLPVGFLDHAPARLRDLACGHIDWFRTRLDAPSPGNPSRLRLYAQTEPLEIPALASDPSTSNIPNLLLVVDSSGSMGFNPRAAGQGRGKFDLVLLSSWGLLRYISERRLDEQVWVGAVNFSGATRSSGWHRANAAEPVKRCLAFYEGGGTALSTEAIRLARESAPGRFVIIAITDGGLANTQPTLEELRRTMQAGNGVVLLHVGAPNAFTQGVKQLGGSVHILNQAEELVGMCLDVAKANYGGSNG